MRRTCLQLLIAGAGTVVALVTTVASPTLAERPRTRVEINGSPVPVSFNDGDSFRILGGSYAGSQARLAGFNTLESYGPVHSWGNWTEKELYTIAKMATLHARKGSWSCTTDGKGDTYGRLLLWCPDLATDLIRRGYAHALSITDDPARADFLEAQREAIAARRGIWAHGVPDFVLMSLHSKEEDTRGTGTYNRLVSTQDGHSVMWKHDSRYRECEKVCQTVYPTAGFDPEPVLAELETNSAVTPLLRPLSKKERKQLVVDFAAYRHVNRSIAKRQRPKLQRALNELANRGMFPRVGSHASCMRHVYYKRRFARVRPECLQ